MNEEEKKDKRRQKMNKKEEILKKLTGGRHDFTKMINEFAITHRLEGPLILALLSVATVELSLGLGLDEEDMRVNFSEMMDVFKIVKGDKR